ncbi:unnamed protein product [Schistosoma turkestanicum]|nr:unnamed protein product [Schistosoma turkestanicum]
MKIENTDRTDHQTHDEHKEKEGLSKDGSKYLGNVLDICRQFCHSINWLLPKCDKRNFDKSTRQTESDLTLSALYRQNLYGLIFGIVLGFIVYGLFVTVLDQHPFVSTLSSAYIIMLSIYAFSANFRCIALMTFPYLASGDVRCLILLYASDLCIFELGQSFLYNFEVFTSSFDCIISKIDQSLFTVHELNRPLFNAFNVLLGRLVHDFNSMLQYIRSVLTDINFNTIKIFSAIDYGNGEIDKLYKRCINSDAHYNLCAEFLQRAFIMCRTELKIFVGDLSDQSVQREFQSACLYLKNNQDTICNNIQVSTDSCYDFSEFIANSSHSSTAKNMTDRMERIIDVIGKENVTFLLNSDELDRVASEVDEELTDFKHSHSGLRQFEEMKFLISSLLFLWTMYTMMQLIVKSTVFRNCWLNKISFDNHYITPEYIRQEKQAVQQGHRPTLPLTPDESEHYKMLFDLSWSHREKSTITNANILHNMWIFIIIMIILFIHAMNSCLLSLALLISHDFFQSKRIFKDYLNTDPLKLNDAPKYSIFFNGAFYQNFLYDIINARLQLKHRMLYKKIISCRPSVNSLHFNNMLIVTLIVLTILSQLTEVYLMRLRHIIMMWYYPQKSYRRSVWLREHINIKRDAKTKNEPGYCLMNNSELHQELYTFNNNVSRQYFSNFNVHNSEENNSNRPEFDLNLCPICQNDLVCEKCRTLLGLK